MWIFCHFFYSLWGHFVMMLEDPWPLKSGRCPVKFCSILYSIVLKPQAAELSFWEAFPVWDLNDPGWNSSITIYSFRNVRYGKIIEIEDTFSLSAKTSWGWMFAVFLTSQGMWDISSQIGVEQVSIKSCNHWTARESLRLDVSKTILHLCFPRKKWLLLSNIWK